MFIAINVLINKVIGSRLNEDDLKKVLILMQQKLFHGQSKAQDVGNRNDNDDLIDNDRALINLDNINDVTRTNSEVYEENPMTILIFKAKDKPKLSQDQMFVKNLLKEIILHEKLNHKKYPVNSKTNFKANEFSKEVKDLKKFSKLFLILNTSPNRNVNDEELNDLGRL